MNRAKSGATPAQTNRQLTRRRWWNAAAQYSMAMSSSRAAPPMYSSLSALLQDVGSAMRPQGADALTKVVLARRSDVVFHGELDALALLATLQVEIAAAGHFLKPARTVAPANVVSNLQD